MDENTLLAISLSETKGIGPIYFHKLLKRFESFKNIYYNTSIDELSEIVPEHIARRILEHDFSKAEKIIKICERHNIKIITCNSKDYPKRLLSIHTPPPILYVKGDVEKINNVKLVGMVGTRKPTQYGVQAAQLFAKELAKADVGIVSGGAYGIDAISLKTALKEGAYTIAVLGNGLLNPYPSANRGLFKEIVEKGGAVISEFSPEERPNKENFPRRNRIISGLSDILLVVEAGEKSGSLITVSWAEEQNVEVYAIPGPITSETSKGTNLLISRGAKIALTPQNILNDMGITYKRKERELKISEEERQVLDIIGGEPIHIDSIAEKLNVEIFKLTPILFALELKGILRQLPGKYYVKEAL